MKLTFLNGNWATPILNTKPLLRNWYYSCSQLLYFENSVFTNTSFNAFTTAITEIDKQNRMLYLENMPINAKPLFEVYPPIDLSIN